MPSITRRKRHRPVSSPVLSRVLDRRQFLLRAGLGTAAVGFSAGLGCDRRQPAPSSPPGAQPVQAAPDSNPVQAADAAQSVQPLSTSAQWEPFPTIEAGGTPEELGATVGRLTAEKIRRTIAGQQQWFDTLRAYATADRAARIEPFVNAIERHHPEVLAELRGMARGAGLPEEDLIIWNLQPELGTMRRRGAVEADGCSTLHLVAGDRMLLAHNEDGNATYRQDLVILRLRPAGKPQITCLAYPGLVPGQVPGINSAGLLVSTNFISTHEVRPGVPRYVLGRAVLGCSTIDEAVAVATNRDRAFAFNLNLGFTGEPRRLVCLEVAPRVHDLSESRGLFVHTNHLVLPRTRTVPQDGGTPTDSSGSRLGVLTRAVAAHLASPESVTEQDLIRMLSSHEAQRQPYSPCRHAGSSSSGQTLATALFDVSAGTFALYEGNPCEGRRRVLVSGEG